MARKVVARSGTGRAALFPERAGKRGFADPADSEEPALARDLIGFLFGTEAADRGKVGAADENRRSADGHEERAPARGALVSRRPAGRG